MALAAGGDERPNEAWGEEVGLINPHEPSTDLTSWPVFVQHAMICVREGNDGDC